MTGEEDQPGRKPEETIQDRSGTVLAQQFLLEECRPDQDPPMVAKFSEGAKEFYAELAKLSTKPEPASSRSKRLVSVITLIAVSAVTLAFLGILWPGAGLLGKIWKSTMIVGLLIMLGMVGVGAIYYSPVTHGREHTFWVLSGGYNDVSVGVSTSTKDALQSAYEMLRTLGQFTRVKTSVGAALGYPDGVPDDKTVHVAELQVTPDQPGDHIISEEQVDPSEPEALTIQLEQIIDDVYRDHHASAVQVTVAPQLDTDRLLSQYERHLKTWAGTGLISLLRHLPSEKAPANIDDGGRKETIDNMENAPTFAVTIRALVVTPTGVPASDVDLLEGIEESVGITEDQITPAMVRRSIQMGVDTDIRQADAVTNTLLKRFHNGTLENTSAATTIRRTPAYFTVQGADVWRYALVSTVTKPQLATQLNAIRRDQTIPPEPSNPYYKEEMQGEPPFEKSDERNDTAPTDDENDPDESSEDDTDESDSNEGEQ